MAYTTIDNPELFFQSVLWTGNDGSNALTLGGSENMQPDIVWLAARTKTDNKRFQDSVRGAGKMLPTNGNGAEESLSEFVSFDSDGFTLNTSDGGYNDSSYTYVAWCWKAGGSASNNTEGDIQSSVSVSQTAGCSIVSYTGNATANQTVGHGLGAVPQMIIGKNRDNTSSNYNDWTVYHHKNATANDKKLRLNTTAAVSSTNEWGDTDPTSSVFSVHTGGDGATNDGSDKIMAYCYAEIQGYSKFGKYEGNGNAAGPYVYTGFKPAWVMTKSMDSTSNWVIFDNKRSTFNDRDDYLKANATATEDTGSSDVQIDFLANGFKQRGNNDESNASETFIYMAIAESPFVNSNGIPTNAE